LSSPPALLVAVPVFMSLWPYFSGKYARRALLTDLLVVIVTSLWVQWGLGAL
jgi:hypothetical protein